MVAKYEIRVSVTSERGTRHPAEPEVWWRVRRVVDPVEDVGGRDVMLGPKTERVGELQGAVTAIRHAEARGETLAREDIEVEVEHVTNLLKRQKLDNVKRSNHPRRMVRQDVYEEIMKRPRPLAGGRARAAAPESDEDDE
jgi:hypothetical protein